MPDLFSRRGPRPIGVARTMIDVSRGKVNADTDAARVWLVAQADVPAALIERLRSSGSSADRTCTDWTGSVVLEIRPAPGNAAGNDRGEAKASPALERSAARDQAQVDETIQGRRHSENESLTLILEWGERTCGGLAIAGFSAFVVCAPA
jgi:hypothetical protein